MKYVSIFSLLFLINSTAWAFPQLIRHGYTNCTSCHASPNGGGVMTEYGRALSREVLSTWGYEGEEQWHYGAFKKEDIPSWLHVGGDYRAVQIHTKDNVQTRGRFITMQEQVELAGKFNNTWISVKAGADTLKDSRPWYIPSFYVSHQIIDKLNIRVGKFLPRFGINVPDHIFSTRGPLGFGYQTERDSLEMTYTEEKWDVSITGVSGKFKNETEASAIYSQVNYSPTNKSKLGVSFEKMTKNDRRLSVGAHAMVGFTEKLYLITDSVWQTKETLQKDQRGIYHFAKLGLEMEQGLHLILLEDFRKSDLSRDRSSQNMYGVGFNFFPRPHIELQGVWAKRQDLARSKDFGDYAWLLMHFYL